MAVLTNLQKKIKSPKKFTTSKKIGLILIITASIGYLGLFLKWIPFLHNFLLGTFGLFSYIIFSVLYIIGAALLRGAKYVYSKKYIILLLTALISTLSIFHIAFTYSISLDGYFSYLGEIYSMQTSVGGVLLGLIVYFFQKFMYSLGAIFFFLIVLGASVWMIYDYLIHIKDLKRIDNNIFKKKVERKEIVKTSPIGITIPDEKRAVKIGLDAQLDEEERSREKALKQLGLKESRREHYVDSKQMKTFVNDFVNEPEESIFTDKSSREANNRKPSGRLEPGGDISGTFGYNIFTPPKQKKTSSNYEKNKEFLQATMEGSLYIPPKNQKNTADDLNLINETQRPPKSYEESYNTTALKKQKTNLSKQDFLDANFGNFSSGNKQKLNSEEEEISSYQTEFESKNQMPETLPSNDDSDIDRDGEMEDIKTNTIEEIDLKNFELPQSLLVSSESRRNRIIKHSENQTSIFSKPEIPSQQPEKPKFKSHRYIYPTTDLLPNTSTNPEDYGGDYQQTAQAIETILEDFRIPAKIKAVTVGPAVTRYELEMPPGISVNKIVQHANDISMAVASSHGVRIEAPIPGKSAVGIEVPNAKIATVGLREVLESKEFSTSKANIAFAVGKEVSGAFRVADMNNMPHLLIAGATGSGKSVALNSMIISMLYKYSPEELRIVLIDPKQVEFFVFNGLPHLLTPEVITEPAKALNALTWAMGEMDRRYSVFRECGVKEVMEYNKLPEVQSGEREKLPYIVMIVDEVGDIMSMPHIKKDFEEKACRIAQKARASGIHLVLATQRPSVNVITGLIKANLPSRMAFAVTNFQDSKTILDTGGADKLLGRGDMLYAPRDFPEPKRIQGCYISNSEVKAVVDFIKQNNDSDFDGDIEREINREDTVIEETTADPNGNDFDVLMKDALRLVIQAGSASASMLQRRFSIGSPRAARIIDQMEIAKFISPPDGSKPRSVYITAEQYRILFKEEV